MKIFTKLAAGLALTVATSASAQNILLNGGFENNSGVTFTADLSDDGIALNDTRLIPPGDTTISNVEIASPPQLGTYYTSGAATNNPEGDFYVWLDGVNNCVQFSLNGSGLSTSLVDNQMYEVSFYAAAWDVDMDVNYVPTGTTVAQTDSPFIAELQDADNNYHSLSVGPTITAPATTGGYGVMNWLQYTYNFTHDSSNSATDYRNLVLSSVSPGEGVAFDNVSLVAVPEASTGLLSTFGLLCLVMTRRRK